MSPRTRYLFLVTAVVTLVAIAVIGAHRARQAEATLAALDDERRHMADQLHDLQRQFVAAEKSVSSLRTLPAQATRPPPATTPNPSPPRPNFAQIVRDDPRLQNLKHAARRAQLFITYGPLYRSLGLTAAQVRDFEEALLRREEQSQDIRAAAQTAADRVAARKLVEQVDADYAASLRHLLGETEAKQVQLYERQVLLRDVVSGLAGAAAMAGVPLEQSQAEQLTAALADAAAPFAPGGWHDPQRIDWTRVQEQARAFLSPEQLTFIATTEPRGPRGMGGRFLGQLNAMIDQAVAAEASASAP